MKRLKAFLLIPAYLLILSSVFVPMSHDSWAGFAKDLVVRFAIVLAFSVATTIFLNFGSAEPYRITHTTVEDASEDGIEPTELTDEILVNHPQNRQKRSRWPLAIWIAVAALCWLTETTWWSYQPWAGRLVDKIVGWAALLVCCGFFVVLWLPKPDANQPELLHIAPQRPNYPDSPKPDKV